MSCDLSGIKIYSWPKFNFFLQMQCVRGIIAWCKITDLVQMHKNVPSNLDIWNKINFHVIFCQKWNKKKQLRWYFCIEICNDAQRMVKSVYSERPLLTLAILISSYHEIFLTIKEQGQTLKHENLCWKYCMIT